MARESKTVDSYVGAFEREREIASAAQSTGTAYMR